MKLIEKAQEIAEIAHAGQYRRDGFTPYINHPRTVAIKLYNKGFGPEYVATGWLHDVLEDSKITVNDLINHGFPISVVGAVAILTKTNKLEYRDYIENIVKNNRIARIVKIEDILHNLSDNPTNRQIRKYSHALLQLVPKTFET